jgi:hypothetical protein
LIAGFSHLSYFSRNRRRKHVSTDTKLAQQFAFCPFIQTVQPAAISLRATRAATDRVGAFERSICSRCLRVIEGDPEALWGARDSHVQDHRYARPYQFPAPIHGQGLNRSRATFGSRPCRRRCFVSITRGLNGSFAPIPLKKSFWGGERNFLELLTRFVRSNVRDRVASQKNDYGPSYRRYIASQWRSCPKMNICEIFGVVRFLTFSTQSAKIRRSQLPQHGDK